MQIQEVALNSHEARKYRTLGRLMVFKVNVAGNAPLRIASVYGWTNADKDVEAQERTTATTL
eukprot:9902437-Alexandrium_andersonii.AAC.1